MHWSEVFVGEERALRASVNDVTVLIGYGPPGPGPGLVSRATSLSRELRSQVRALRWCEQVHGRVSAALADEVDRPLEGAACVGRCDGLLTDARGLGLLVWTADCVPVILFGGGVVAAVHAGWRGCVADVAPSVVRRFEVEYGVPAAELGAVLGPAIGPCHYPVGGQVIDGLGALRTGGATWIDGDRVDLRAFLRCRLQVTGIDPDRIVSVGPCTFCDPELASFRRDGERAGRQFSAVFRGSR